MASITRSSYQIPGENKYVLNFDLDSTLLEVTFYDQEDKRSLLSNSAQLELSKSVSGGTMKDPVIRGNSYLEERAETVRAFAREKFKEIFDKIAEINRKAGETVIYVNILTNAAYTEPHVRSVLKQFYGPDFAFHSFSNRYRYYNTKGEQIFNDYMNKYSDLGIPIDHDYLIDDNEKNCKGSEDYGFKVIRMKTDPSYRLEGDSFSAAKEEIFGELNRIVDSVREKVFATERREVKRFF